MAAAAPTHSPVCEVCFQELSDSDLRGPADQGLLCRACYRSGERAPRLMYPSADTRTNAEIAMCCMCKGAKGEHSHAGDGTHMYCQACWQIESDKSSLWSDIRAIRESHNRQRTEFFQSICQSYVRMARQSILLAAEMQAPQAKIMMSPEHSGMAGMLYYHFLDEKEFKDCCDIKTLCEAGRQALVFTLKQ